jgi:hypothetical protein
MGTTERRTKLRTCTRRHLAEVAHCSARIVRGIDGVLVAQIAGAAVHIRAPRFPRQSVVDRPDDKAAPREHRGERRPARLVAWGGNSVISESIAANKVSLQPSQRSWR